MIEQDIYTILTNALSCGVYPVGGVPENTNLLYVTYEKIAQEWEHYQGGSINLAESRIQINVWAESLSEALTQEELIRTALDCYSTGNIKYAHMISCSSDYEKPSDGSSKGTHRQIMDFNIWQTN